MNCSYRILKDVHIGVRVRKTKDKTTVPFKNEPMTDVYIKDWNDQGFNLQHKSFPTKGNTVWLDFNQLPLNQLNIEMGYIKNPITFVEAIASYGGGTSMVLIRADIFDYLELLNDKKQKDESKLYKPSDLKVGDRVVSAICREGNVMVYLGTFGVANLSERYLYNYSNYSNGYNCHYIDQTPERAFFAYEQKDGKYNVKAYPLTNKIVKELYGAADKGRGNSLDPAFTSEDENLKMINYLFFKQKYAPAKLKKEFRPENEKNNYPHIKLTTDLSLYGLVYAQKGKKDLRKNAYNFVKESCNVNEKQLFQTAIDMEGWHSALKR